jgi:hypothetical protein
MRMCRRPGIEGECSTEIGRKGGKKMCGLVGERADGVGMRYEGLVTSELVADRGSRLLSMVRRGFDYAEWPVGNTVSGKCESGGAAFGPRTSGN